MNDRCRCRHDRSFHAPDGTPNCTVCGCIKFDACEHKRCEAFMRVTGGPDAGDYVMCVVCKIVLREEAVA